MTNKSRPKWNQNFRGFPEIPLNKRWRKENRYSLEQEIYMKLTKNETISNEHQAVMRELYPFYEELTTKLKSFNYNQLKAEEVELFAGYILYAFNWVSLLINEITLFHTFRLVVNEYVSGSNTPITDSKFLKYPPLEINIKNNKFNRANTPQSTIFYSSENGDTLLKEIRPPLNKLLTVGVWETINSEDKFIAFPISHSKEAELVNPDTRAATKAVNEHSVLKDTLLGNHYKIFTKAMSYEFTKTVTHHYGYIISALFTEGVLDAKMENEKMVYDMILYPSVGNNFKTNNLAILPHALESKMKLVSAIEFELIEVDFDREIGRTEYSPEITIGKIKNRRRTKSISKNGRLNW